MSSHTKALLTRSLKWRFRDIQIIVPDLGLPQVAQTFCTRSSVAKLKSQATDFSLESLCYLEFLIKLLRKRGKFYIFFPPFLC